MKDRIINTAYGVAKRAHDRHARFMDRQEPAFGDRDLVNRLHYRLDDGLESIRAEGPSLDLLTSLAADLLLLLAVQSQEAEAGLAGFTQATPGPDSKPWAEPVAEKAAEPAAQVQVQAAKHAEPPVAAPAPVPTTPPDRASLLTLAEIAEMWACKRDTANWRLKHNKVSPVVPSGPGKPGLYDLAAVLRVGALYVKAPVAAPAPDPEPAPVAPRCGDADVHGYCGEDARPECADCSAIREAAPVQVVTISNTRAAEPGLTVEQIAARTGLLVRQVRTIARGSTLVEIPSNRPPRYTEASVAALERSYKTRRAAA